MSFTLKNKLVVAVASSALFDLKESDAVFQKDGEDKYRMYQRENENNKLSTGVAFPLVKRLLALNAENEESFVEVILFSKNDPDTGLRVFKSIEYYGLPITRAVFVTGRNPFSYMNAFNVSLFLSGNQNDVREAIAQGLPAGYVDQKTSFLDDDYDELRIAFDFDGVLADDSSEKVYKEKDITEYHQHGRKHASQPLPDEPLYKFSREISHIQQKELEKAKQDKTTQISHNEQLP